MDTNIAINLRVTVAMYRAKAAVKTAPVAVMTPRQVGIKKWAIQKKMVKIGVYGKITTELGRGSRCKALTKRLLLLFINRSFKRDKRDKTREGRDKSTERLVLTCRIVSLVEHGSIIINHAQRSAKNHRLSYMCTSGTLRHNDACNAQASGLAGENDWNMLGRSMLNTF
ncbi:hypothetical protein Naga_100221g10 [Nannochloropsis gaditana]|uniref:Uncharacterized protein n=1 Tax=Nannochloropsis gaditana TaxID=72520 RepID=W7TK06_9STRA|nr:hypothetical protein Naga_100221g10 [Nannochloropsis gaditana]